MNYKKLGALLGKLLLLEAVLMLAPLAVSLLYREPRRNILAFLLPCVLLAALGLALGRLRPERSGL